MWGHVVQLTLKPGSIFIFIFLVPDFYEIFLKQGEKKIVMHESRELGEKPQRKIKYFCMSGACHVMAPTRARASLAPQTWPSSSSTGCTPSGPYPVSQSLLPHHLLPCSHDLGPGPSDPHRVPCWNVSLQESARPSSQPLQPRQVPSSRAWVCRAVKWVCVHFSKNL